jgi:hypothetical protein
MGGFASFVVVRLKLFTLDDRLVPGRQLAKPLHPAP